jgi:hypothetical protein
VQLAAEHVLQALESELGIPLPFVEKETNEGKTLCAGLLQLRHKASSSARLMGRSNSNLSLQFGQKYSYMGIVFSSTSL